VLLSPQFLFWIVQSFSLDRFCFFPVFFPPTISTFLLCPHLSRPHWVFASRGKKDAFSHTCFWKKVTPRRVAHHTSQFDPRCVNAYSFSFKRKTALPRTYFPITFFSGHLSLHLHPPFPPCFPFARGTLRRPVNQNVWTKFTKPNFL